MKIDHLHFYVDNACRWRDWFMQVMGFTAVAHSQDDLTQTEVVAAGERSPIVFFISSPLSSTSPIAQYLIQHPLGVADISLGVSDCPAVWQRSLAAGAKVIQPLQIWESERGTVQWGTLQTQWGSAHTLIERQGITPWLPDRFWQDYPRSPWSSRSLFQGIDHVVLNLPAADFAEMSNWYQSVFGFEPKQSFAIETERSGLYSQVLIHPDSGLQLPINAPKGDCSQIQEFLTVNRGAGVQHVALQVADIIAVVRELRLRSLAFLEVPDGYYQGLQDRVQDVLTEEEWHAIQSLGILADYEESQDVATDRIQDSPLLLQIFSQPIFTEPTFFFECIERRSQAKGFGEGNFQALFEAIERQQMQRNC